MSSSGECQQEERVRVVVLGAAGVGKSCIVKRFLLNVYTDRYKRTVEDLYTREYDLGYTNLKVDILDTAGDQQFPAMRRLSLATASAFILVYDSSNKHTFDEIRRCLNEIREQRNDFQAVPMVIAGNKCDLPKTSREVAIEDVSEWLFCELPKMRAKIIECSARDDIAIKDIFKTLLALGKPFKNENSGVDCQGVGLKRRSSAYVSATSKNKTRSSSSGGVGPDTNNTDTSTSKPRSRSLIRRTSRKCKQSTSTPAPDECRTQ